MWLAHELVAGLSVLPAAALRHAMLGGGEAVCVAWAGHGVRGARVLPYRSCDAFVGGRRVGCCPWICRPCLGVEVEEEVEVEVLLAAVVVVLVVVVVVVVARCLWQPLRLSRRRQPPQPSQPAPQPRQRLGPPARAPPLLRLGRCRTPTRSWTHSGTTFAQKLRPLYQVGQRGASCVCVSDSHCDAPPCCYL
jgi:hypothetical protein